jgi:hypothetical protein
LGKGLASGTHDVKGINPLSPALEVRSLSFWVVEPQHNIPEGDELLSEKDSLVALCKYFNRSVAGAIDEREFLTS